MGLIGVVVGSLLNVARDWWLERRKNRKDAVYLSIQVSCKLERYLEGCVRVVDDDGYRDGEPGEKHYASMLVKEPKFEPMALDVEWKSLPAELLYEILDFPNKAEQVDQKINAIFAFGQGEPEYMYEYEERQIQYAILGVAASKLATRLRKHASLPIRSYEDWNPVNHIEEKMSAIESKRAERSASFDWFTTQE